MVLVRRALLSPAGPLRVVSAELDPSVVRDLCLTGRVLSPEQARELRVVDELLEPRELLARALELAPRLQYSRPGDRRAGGDGCLHAGAYRRMQHHGRGFAPNRRGGERDGANPRAALPVTRAAPQAGSVSRLLT